VAEPELRVAVLSWQAKQPQTQHRTWEVCLRISESVGHTN